MEGNGEMKILKKKMEELREFMQIANCSEAGTGEVVNDTVTDILKEEYDAFDCPVCGCQHIAQGRLRRVEVCPGERC